MRDTPEKQAKSQNKSSKSQRERRSGRLCKHDPYIVAVIYKKKLFFILVIVFCPEAIYAIEAWPSPT